MSNNVAGYRLNNRLIMSDIAGASGASSASGASGTSGASGCSGSNNVSGASGVQEKELVGKGSWNSKTIKQAGLELPSKYFIAVYTDYYRFNPDAISKDFPNKSIQTLQDLKKAIDANKTEITGASGASGASGCSGSNNVSGASGVQEKELIGKGSWNSKSIKQAGLELPSKYFIAVYTDYYRFNPDTISKDFPNKSIQTLQDLKKAIDELSIKNAFAYDGKDTQANSKTLQADYIIDKPLFYTFGIPKTGAPNSQVSGTGSYGTGRKDNYVAYYDEKGRICKIEASSSYGNKVVEYSYNENGEMLEVTSYLTTGAVIDNTYNSDGTLKTHSEYMSQENKNKGRAFITRDYTYSVNDQGQPVQTMVNSAGVKVITTRNADGTYTRTKEKTIQNDDGSYRVIETDAKTGKEVKRTDYDSNGRITHEWILNDEDSYSDKYYTYNNGKLVQVQETIHYSDGNYTYIFKDGDGNLKEIQKVIHNNEYGGMTFDTTFGDGRRTVLNLNDKDQAVYEVHYSSDGALEKTQEFTYDENNPNRYTITTKSPDGKITSKELWENFEVEGGGGSRLLQRIEYDENGNVTSIKNYNNYDGDNIDNNHAKILADLQSQINSTKDGELKAKLEDNYKKLEQLYAQQQSLSDKFLSLQDEIKNMEPPKVPNKYDFTDENGNVDELAYDKAMRKYEQARTDYNNKINELNKKLNIYQRQDRLLEQQAQQILTQCNTISGYSDALEHLKEVIDNTTDPEVKAALQDEYNNLKEAFREAMVAADKENEVRTQITNLEYPLPPEKLDFTYSYYQGIASGIQVKVVPDGNGNYQAIRTLIGPNGPFDEIIGDVQVVYDRSGNIAAVWLPDGQEVSLTEIKAFDELAFDNAMARYEQYVASYQQELAELNKKLLAYQKVGQNAELKKESVNNTINLIQEFAGALSKLQGEIKAATDPSAKAELQAKYNELQLLMKQAIETSKEADDILLEAYTAECPKPPAKSDYEYHHYRGYANGSPVELVLNANGKHELIQHIIGPDGTFDVTIEDAQVIYDRSGHITAVWLPDGQKVPITEIHGYDELAYDNAMAIYKQDLEAYEQKIAEQKEKVDILNNQLAKILEQAGINFEKGNNIEITAERQNLDTQGQMINQQMTALTEKMNQLYEHIFNLPQPVPPNRVDFSYTDENGNRVYDELAYDKAMREYEEAKAAYDNEVARLNRQIELYQRQQKLLELDLKATVNQRNELLDQQYLLKSIAQKITGDLSPEKADELKSIYSQISSLVLQNIALNQVLNEIRAEVRSREIPTPPNIADYALTTEDGRRIYDELAYDNAMAMYEADKAEYDKFLDQINERTRVVAEKQSEIHEQIQELKVQADKIN